jgi:hypothetical protein
MMGTSKRGEYLPTLHVSVKAIERYRQWLQKDGGAAGAEDPVQPVDAYLFRLLLEMLPPPLVLLDLAAETTQGASSVLGLSHPHVRRVVVTRTSASESQNSWLSSLDAFRQECSTDTMLEVMGDLGGRTNLEDSLRALGRGPGLIVLLSARAGRGEELTATVQACLRTAPHAVVLVMGLGRVGTCPALDALLHVARPPYRLHLLRELSPVLGSSSLGLVATSVADANAVLVRIEELYRTNYQLLDWLMARNLQAIHGSSAPSQALPVHPLRNLQTNHGAGDSQRGLPTHPLQLALEEQIAQLQQTVKELQSGLAFQVTQGLRRWRHRLVPEGSWRASCFRGMLRAMRVVRRGGLTRMRLSVRRNTVERLS